MKKESHPRERDLNKFFKCFLFPLEEKIKEKKRKKKRREKSSEMLLVV